MPPKTVPPPPRPDPVTLDQIYERLTSTSTSMDEKAYHLVALNTVAFHSTVKLYLYENSSLPAESPNTEEAEVLHRLRREKLVKAIAFFVAQRNNAVCQECRWETVSLIGELCRIDNNGGAPSSTGSDLVEGRLNGYARRNLEFLAQLPWFAPALETLMGPEAAASVSRSLPTVSVVAADGGAEKSSSNGSCDTGDLIQPTTSRRALQAHLQKQRKEREAATHQEGHSGVASTDEDVVVALQDIYRALPTVVRSEDGKRVVSYQWSPENKQQALDLMFLDASTSMLHLIPTVSRCLSTQCAQCLRLAKEGEAFHRCSSCKAPYYCSAACQKLHWAVHRTPCVAYKERCSIILEEYYALNATAKRKKKDLQKDEVAILEVPLEPSIFFLTRRYLYDHRDASFSHVDFNDYFMKYTVKGT